MALIAIDFSGLKATMQRDGWVVRGECLFEPIAPGIRNTLKNTLLNQVVFSIRAVICL
ncbi:hypothetical protein [Burkholderia cenocepacia]|uniref:hypothetical protein n=1 Tax=Burkholderia cenocepacia TaxID=95486 RepID=UPI002AB25838|nr:hypothetical protein [Burkholderia cenocepacia]